MKKGNPARNKAKNAILRLEHSLTYQVQTVLHVDVMDLSGHEDQSDPKKQRLGQGQTQLAFAPVPKQLLALTADNLAMVA